MSRAASPMSNASASDDDAPESFSLSQSKKAAKTRQNDLQKFRAAEKQKKKEINRERNRRIKEGKEKRSTDKVDKEASNGEEEGGDPELEARMRRAMEEAANESDLDSNLDSEEGEAGKDQIMHGEELDENEDDDESGSSAADPEEDDEAMSSVDDDELSDEEDASSEMDEDALPESLPTKSNPNYLPDHLFTAAFTSQSDPSSRIKKSKSEAKLQSHSKTTKRRRRTAGSKAKDTIVGSRALRVLPKVSQQASLSASHTVPSQKVHKFVNRSLNLQGRNPPKKGWQRLPANIGVMRRSGPASSFVRR